MNLKGMDTADGFGHCEVGQNVVFFSNVKYLASYVSCHISKKNMDGLIVFGYEWHMMLLSEVLFFYFIY